MRSRHAFCKADGFLFASNEKLACPVKTLESLSPSTKTSLSSSSW